MTRTLELFGKYQTGDRCWDKGQPFKVARVLNQSYWSPDRIDDEDEFGREPGWYSTAEIVEDTLTVEELDQIAKEQAEKAAARDDATAKLKAYKEKLAELIEAHEKFAVGLIPAGHFNPSVLQELTREVIGVASKPGSGSDGVTELVVCRDAAGQVKAVMLGVNWRMASELLEKSADKKRIWQWWSPTGYHANSYPGPAVPLEELTAVERDEVARLEAARLEMIRSETVRSLEGSAKSALEERGLIEPDSRRYGPVKTCPVKARGYSLEFGPEFESSVFATADQKRTRKGNHPQLEGITLRVTLGPEAYAKAPRSRKPAPIDTLPTTLKLHNFAEAAVVYERAE